MPGEMGMGCPDIAFKQEGENIMTSGYPPGTDAVVAWLRDHLTGAVYTP